MRISDWSSDVCYSDLLGGAQEYRERNRLSRPAARPARRAEAGGRTAHRRDADAAGLPLHFVAGLDHPLSFRSRAQHPAPASRHQGDERLARGRRAVRAPDPARSEEHTSELQSLMRISYAVFCLKKKTHKQHTINTSSHLYT